LLNKIFGQTAKFERVILAAQFGLQRFTHTHA